MLSNYPPGHPTGVSHGESGEIYYCDNCNTLFEKDQLVVKVARIQDGQRNLIAPSYKCKECLTSVVRAECDCGKPATHIDEDREVNAAEAFCDEHGMR
jgi:hypothetical protein